MILSEEVVKPSSAPAGGERNNTRSVRQFLKAHGSLSSIVSSILAERTPKKPRDG